MKAEDLLDKFAKDEGFGNWETVVLNCHHSVIRSVAIAAVNEALRRCNVSDSVCNCEMPKHIYPEMLWCDRCGCKIKD